MTRGAVAIYDWAKLHEQWELTTNVSLKAWCEAQHLNYTNASRKFTEIEREIEERHLQLAKRKLAKSAPLAADKVGDLLNSEDDNIALRASTAILDRVGLSPQSVTQNTQVNVQVNVPAMFSTNENEQELKSLLMGEQRPNAIIESSQS